MVNMFAKYGIRFTLFHEFSYLDGGCPVVENWLIGQDIRGCQAFFREDIRRSIKVVSLIIMIGVGLHLTFVKRFVIPCFYELDTSK